MDDLTRKVRLPVNGKGSYVKSGSLKTEPTMIR